MKLEIGEVDVSGVPAVTVPPLDNRQVMIAFTAAGGETDEKLKFKSQQIRRQLTQASELSVLTCWRPTED